MSLRYYIFLKDVLMLALTAFGGPQAHMAMMLTLLVDKRRYITEQELIELNALCQILPGPTSTQTITAIGFKIGGPNLAYLTLLVWLLPASVIMTVAALIISYLQEHNISLSFLRFIQPMAVGFVAYAAYMIGAKVIHTKTATALMVASAIVSYFFNSPWMFPVLLIAGGAVTAVRFRLHPREENKQLRIQWANFVLYVAVLIVAAAIGGITHSLPVRLFENFYRNGSLIFGGGQVLIPLLYTEFVDFKHYLTGEEFLSGYAIVQALPGPVFSFCSYIGTLSIRDAGVSGQILGSLMATAGIFLPGTFFIFFVIRFWDELKKYRVVRASLEGISAVSTGMVVAAAILLFHQLESSALNIGFVLATFCLLMFTRVPAPVLILTGLLLGFIL
ncbi:chromate efflux transporter [Pontibacter silvestris]|uniref:Chromate efflux transporter n=1 Tax=Pontibacter silvestris TaxID=2305183 RepID=A0ABW4WVB2_9BACT|nr:chromate efflux transporter [Pontibacter silvestris]MCC9136604.1 chromate efflux transporter [Pontibacter silvestris]